MLKDGNSHQNSSICTFHTNAPQRSVADGSVSSSYHTKAQLLIISHKLTYKPTCPSRCTLNSDQIISRFYKQVRRLTHSAITVSITCKFFFFPRFFFCNLYELELRSLHSVFHLSLITLSTGLCNCLCRACHHCKINLAPVKLCMAVILIHAVVAICLFTLPSFLLMTKYKHYVQHCLFAYSTLLILPLINNSLFLFQV